MKILIAYAGETGTTEKCARLLGKKLGNTTTIDLKKENANVSDYDLIIIGSSIRMGVFHDKARKFIKKNKDYLKIKDAAYFICCCTKDYQKYFDTNIPKELLNSAITYDSFGGEMDISKQRGLNKFIVKMIASADKTEKITSIIPENIDKFVEKIKEVIK